MSEKQIYQVLIVDDEPHVLQTIPLLLEEHIPYELEIFQANSVIAALAVMRRRRIDILITDIQMPKLDGLQLTHIVRQRWQECKTIILTAHADFSYARSAIQEDVFAYVLKSESDEMLISEILRALHMLDSQMQDIEHLLTAQNSADEQVECLLQETMRNLIRGSYARDPRSYRDALRALQCAEVDDPVCLFCLQSPQYTYSEQTSKQLKKLCDRHMKSVSAFRCFTMAEERFWGILQLKKEFEIHSIQDVLSSVVEQFSEMSGYTTVCLFSPSIREDGVFYAQLERMKHYNVSDAESSYVHELQSDSPPSYSKYILKPVTEYIQKNLFGDVRLETLAKVAGYNASYLSRLFLKHMGMNLSNYIADCKIKSLIELMKNPQLTLDEISEIGGFECRSTFNRFVKRMTGFSLKHFREK